MKDFLKRLFYRFGWDTRTRNVLPAQLVRRALAGDRRGDLPLLDVGCGYPGLASFLSEVSVVGVDLGAPPAKAPNVNFQCGSILALPYKDRSFQVVSCIDVLEHLTITQRGEAVRELLRVASRAVLIACPHGSVAEALDHSFLRDLKSHQRPVPDWVNEHVQQPFPEQAAITDHVRRAAGESGRTVDVSHWYVEPSAVSKLIRAAAARSDLMYAAVNLFFGILFPLMPRPSGSKSYRLVLLALLKEPGDSYQPILTNG